VKGGYQNEDLGALNSVGKWLRHIVSQ